MMYGKCVQSVQQVVIHSNSEEAYGSADRPRFGTLARLALNLPRIVLMIADTAVASTVVKIIILAIMRRHVACSHKFLLSTCVR
jgi:hypothetical protein